MKTSEVSMALSFISQTIPSHALGYLPLSVAGLVSNSVVAGMQIVRLFPSPKKEKTDFQHQSAPM
jgi:hypothetical protein